MLTKVVFNPIPDYTGVNLNYRIQNEQHVLTKNQFRDLYFIVPEFSTFFADNIEVKFKDAFDNTIRILTEGIDYYCALPYIGATRAIGKPIYGAIGFNNISIAGSILISYQALGGDWSFNQRELLTILAEMTYNPRTTTWETITGVPTVFPAIPHQWDLQDLVGQTEVVAGLKSIENAIINKALDSPTAHFSDYSNPHVVTKAQLGLGNLGNWDLASTTEAIAGALNDKLITPETLKSVLDGYYTKLQTDLQLSKMRAPKTSSAKILFLTQT